MSSEVQTKTLRLSPGGVTGEQLEVAAGIAKRGGVLLYPTDTIYGLGCNAFEDGAARRILKIKDRAESKPFILLASDVEMVNSLVAGTTVDSEAVMKAFWPGPLTIIFRASPKISATLTAGTGSVAIRIPNNRFCLELIRACRFPLVSTSANRSGEVPSSEIGKLREQFEGLVDLIVDGGNAQSMLPSTVLDLSSESPRIVREGAVARAELVSHLPSIAWK